MTRLELRDLLLNRVGWKSDPVYIISDENKTSESGRFFQDEHYFVSLEMIQNLRPNVNDGVCLDDQLEELTSQVVLHVVDEALTAVSLNEITPSNMFDSAISKRMAMKIGEMVWTTTQSNRNERISKEYAQQIFFDINGDPNFPSKLSISAQYAKEIDWIKDQFNTEGMLDVVTLGTIERLSDDDVLKFGG